MGRRREREMVVNAKLDPSFVHLSPKAIRAQSSYIVVIAKPDTQVVIVHRGYSCASSEYKTEFLYKSVSNFFSQMRRRRISYIQDEK